MLILGGTFDPPHIGHLLLAESARRELGEEAAVLMPAGDPWRKTGNREQGTGNSGGGGQQPTAARMRLAMVRLAVRDANARPPHSGPTANSQQPTALVVDDREIRRLGPTYTAETLAELRAEGHLEITLLLGSDALADMPNWHQPGRILELARIAVTAKPGETPLAVAREVIEAAVPGAWGRVLVLRTVPPLQISSTQVRQRVREGLSIRYLVPRPVERYIARHGLYRLSG